ncbi:hypothetical protein FNV43_RR07096 [Rhamnella rubrinervis]|uniref:Uncharacterized protein n=1 Tax=Rhamnella rubrinervis TaxID=2594499 RepID=A0A8K0HE50_9ROSA|nr:hypothetical protein FNV43_RR07096 [Rhamnella rubrinervis]
MAEIKHKTTQQSKPRKTSCFLGCVVFPSKLFRKRESPEAVRSGDDGKKTRSWSMLCFKKSATKTVPVDTTTVSGQKLVLDKNNIRSSKLIIKSMTWSKTTDNLRPKRKVSSKPPSEIEVVVAADPDQSTHKEKHLETRYNPAKKHSNSSTDQKRLSFSRKIDSFKTGSGQIRPPEANTRTTPVPSPILLKHGKRVVSRKHSKRETVAHTLKYNPVVGMSIIVVTLLILVLWGRLCAILCTSAWFYFVPRLNYSARDTDDTGLVGTTSNPKAPIDLNSDEYKKKVVLEGFLERNHRSTSS